MPVLRIKIKRKNPYTIGKQKVINRSLKIPFKGWNSFNYQLKNAYFRSISTLGKLLLGKELPKLSKKDVVCFEKSAFFIYKNLILKNKNLKNYFLCFLCFGEGVFLHTFVTDKKFNLVYDPFEKLWPEQYYEMEKPVIFFSYVYNVVKQAKLLSLEGRIKYDKDKVVFDYKDKTKKDISTNFGKYNFKPYKAKILDCPVYSVYATYKNVKLLKDIKKQKNVGKEDYRNFLKRTAIYIANKLLKNVDVVVFPKSSSSILYDIVSYLKNIKPDILFIKDGFVKNTPDRIIIKKDKLKGSKEVEKLLNKLLEKFKKEGYVELKKVPKKFLDAFTNILLPSTNLKAKYLYSKKVAILDDVLSSGKTFKEMLRIVKMFSPSEIKGITIFKTM